MGDPVVRVLSGAPDETELAALIAVLSAIGAAAKPPEPAPAVAPRRPPRFQPATSWRTLR
ncbi:acyl-CoA carboxylase subunit epsilon [Amycolatopsis sp. NPDC051128]|uniref:acyl-CoA carboxylase subunit epsilon n=1 Tax=Amycolatopsis sp. NPDC051128 TaxID=3155412 RepID=UPI00342520AA